jgi:hypothetical protein
LTPAAPPVIVEQFARGRWNPNQQKPTMSARRTPPLSLEGTREVLEEMSRPPRDTPARRRLMERVRIIEEAEKRREIEAALAPKV